MGLRQSIELWDVCKAVLPFIFLFLCLTYMHLNRIKVIHGLLILPLVCYTSFLRTMLYLSQLDHHLESSHLWRKAVWIAMELWLAFSTQPPNINSRAMTHNFTHGHAKGSVNHAEPQSVLEEPFWGAVRRSSADGGVRRKWEGGLGKRKCEVE